MGRWIVSLSVFGLLGMSLGCCHHTAGRCDCDPRTHGCRTGPESYVQLEAANGAAHAPHAEIIKEMPKPKEMPKGAP